MNISLEDWGLLPTTEGIEYLKDACLEDPSKDALDEFKIRKHLLDTDFRTIPEGAFSDARIPESEKSVQIFQLIKAVDISKPLGPEEEAEDEGSTEEDESSKGATKFRGSKRTLRLTLVSPGGTLRAEAIEVSRLPSLTDGCIPGTKIVLFGPLKIIAGFILLERESSIRIIGGKVKRLADGYKLNEEVKARRKDLSHEQSGGAPKFISFMELRKQPKKKQTVQAPVIQNDKPIEEMKETRTIKENVEVSDKLKELQANKLSSDAFAMREKSGKGGKGRRDRHAARRERDDLADQYRPPSRTAPQLAAFVRLDKVSNLEDAQRLHEAVVQEREPEDRPQKGRGKGKGKGGHGESRPSKGKGKGGKGYSRR
jgi:hypothetical protein